MLDIRTPIGAMFAILGCLLGAYGLTTPAEMYRISLGYNLNLLWGGCMLAFGVGMLVWQRLAPQRERELTARVDKELDFVPPPPPRQGAGK